MSICERGKSTSYFAQLLPFLIRDRKRMEGPKRRIILKIICGNRICDRSLRNSHLNSFWKYVGNTQKKKRALTTAEWRRAVKSKERMETQNTVYSWCNAAAGVIKLMRAGARACAWVRVYTWRLAHIHAHGITPTQQNGVSTVCENTRTLYRAVTWSTDVGPHAVLHRKNKNKRTRKTNDDKRREF